RLAFAVDEATGARRIDHARRRERGPRRGDAVAARSRQPASLGKARGLPRALSSLASGRDRARREAPRSRGHGRNRAAPAGGTALSRGLSERFCPTRGNANAHGESCEPVKNWIVLLAQACALSACQDGTIELLQVGPASSSCPPHPAPMPMP